ncbi:Gfo/Idh/MocA family oxidoreductase [Danxiaibacter flavus]|uniref:Gfo/Idh/MocA family oxidoreductase n=1 Tax=Danxiaibacter flavus TaxID=3049108 RepID=A0ABV3ZFP1_9BACT|nr:Gfo/Idh/MocA family oxidoreductase [Chitinophagaceae bacterium DXS]
MQTSKSRRRFIRDLSLGSLSLAPALSSLASCAGATSQKKNGLGIALVGLGGYAGGQLAPALQQTKNCYLAGIVTGTPAKEKIWSDKYNIPQKNIYNYETFDKIADNPDIDIVYVVLPVAMHKEYTIRAAKAGKHVICEKPMAVSSADCQEMIDACKNAGKMLSIGYRLHFEPYNMEMMRLGQQKVFGKIQKLDAKNGFVYGGDPNAWRLKKALAGGGGLMDMGVYCIQGVRYTTGEEPLTVKAREEKLRPELFKEVDETVYWEMKFPSGAIARCKSSYNANDNNLRADAENGWFELSEAYRYGGMAGATSKGKMDFPQINQQAAQMDDFANCIVQKKPTIVPGEMGLQDIKIVEAIYRSIASGKEENV